MHYYVALIGNHDGEAWFARQLGSSMRYACRDYGCNVWINSASAWIASPGVSTLNPKLNHARPHICPLVLGRSLGVTGALQVKAMLSRLPQLVRLAPSSVSLGVLLVQLERLLRVSRRFRSQKGRSGRIRHGWVVGFSDMPVSFYVYGRRSHETTNPRLRSIRNGSPDPQIQGRDGTFSLNLASEYP